jgi:hypothetical protein
MLWKLGYEHGDPSLSNLMVDPIMKCGVLNDWDLSCMNSEGNQGHAGGERTGTIPFMAIDLLYDDYWQGKVARLYRHDLKGLIWVLPWVFLQFDGPKRKNRKLEAWSTGDACRMKKLGLLDKCALNDDTAESWKAEEKFAAVMLNWLRDERHAQRSTRFEPQAKAEAPDADVYRKFCQILESARQFYSPLDELLPSLQMTAALRFTRTGRAAPAGPGLARNRVL